MSEPIPQSPVKITKYNNEDHDNGYFIYRTLPTFKEASKLAQAFSKRSALASKIVQDKDKFQIFVEPGLCQPSAEWRSTLSSATYLADYNYQDTDYDEATSAHENEKIPDPLDEVRNFILGKKHNQPETPGGNFSRVFKENIKHKMHFQQRLPLSRYVEMDETFLINKNPCRKLLDLASCIGFTFHHIPKISGESAILSLMYLLSFSGIKIKSTSIKAGPILSPHSGALLVDITEKIRAAAIDVYERSAYRHWELTRDPTEISSGFRTYRGAWFNAFPYGNKYVLYSQDGWNIYTAS